MAKKNPLLVNPPDLFRRVNRHMTSRAYKNRELIFRQGDKADAMYYIQNGTVKLTVVSKSGKKAVIAILQHGDFFGEGCLIGRSLRRCSATAIQPSTISKVKRATIVRFIHEEPAFAKLLIAYLLSRITRVEDELVDQIFSPSEKRLARILLQLAGFGVLSDHGTAVLRVSQETLAEMVGTTRSRVSHFMNRFRQMGFIDLQRELAGTQGAANLPASRVIRARTRHLEPAVTSIF